MAFAHLLNWIADRKANANAWRDEQRGCGRGCMSVLIVGLGVFSAARLMGGIMGDYGGAHSPAELAEHNREMRIWFATAWGGLIVSYLLGRWWHRRGVP